MRNKLRDLVTVDVPFRPLKDVDFDNKEIKSVLLNTEEFLKKEEGTTFDKFVLAKSKKDGWVLGMKFTDTPIPFIECVHLEKFTISKYAEMENAIIDVCNEHDIESMK